MVLGDVKFDEVIDEVVEGVVFNVSDCIIRFDRVINNSVIVSIYVYLV